jgi:hypothetical protein
LNNRIQEEADRILDQGLLDLLEGHGEVHLVGSYALRLMTWRDLDIHLVTEDCDIRSFFKLGSEIAALLQPHRMHFRDEIRSRTPGLPAGWYWGVYLGDERAGAWKIDVWQTGRGEFEPVRRFGEAIASRLDEQSREIILAIKATCWRHPEYRRGFTSSDVYTAVLDRGVRDVGEFWEDLRKTKGITEWQG